MDATALHLAVNHLPIVGAFLGLALVIFAALRRLDAGAVHAATLVLALSGVGGVVSYLSGEEAEHAAEEEPGFDHDLVEEHEEGGKLAVASLLAAAAVGGWVSFSVARGRGVPVAVTGAWIALSLVAVGTMTNMGLTGRAVGHPDRYAAGPAAAPAGAPAADNAAP